MNHKLNYYLELNDLHAKEIIIDGKTHRCQDTTKSKKNQDGWYRVHTNDKSMVLCLGSFLRGSSEKFFIPNDDFNNLDHTYAQNPPQAPPNKSSKSQETSPIPKVRWDQKWEYANSTGINDLPYVQKKGIDVKKYGLKRQYQNLLTPVNHLNNGFVGIHYINSENGDRFFGKHSQMQAGFFMLGNPDNGSDFIYFEGISDTISIYESLEGYCCINCFSVWNIKAVLTEFKKRWPDRKHIIATDNDETGFKVGNNVAFEHSTQIAIPPIDNGDWNDVYLKYGKDATAKIFEDAITAPQLVVNHCEIEKSNNDELRSVCRNYTKYLAYEVFPTKFEITKSAAIETLNTLHKDSPYLIECIQGLLSVKESQKLSELKTKLTNYLNLDSYNPDFIKKEDLVLGKYLPSEIADKIVSGNGAYCIQSPLGSGKTELIKILIEKLDKKTQLILNVNSAKASILYLTPRQTLTNASSRRLKINDYMVIKLIENLKERKEKARRMACTINSVPSLVYEDFKYDVIVIDECELLINHILGSTIKDKKMLLEHLYALIANAKKVVCLDGYLGKNTIKMLEKAGKPTIHAIINQDKPWQNLDINWINKKAFLIARIMSDLEKGEKVALATNSRKQSEIINEVLLDLKKKGILFNRYTVPLDEQQAVIATPDKANEYYYLVYTPTLESGVSFDLKDFTKVYGIFESLAEGVGTPLACIQQMARFRKATEWIIYCPDKHFDLPVTKQEINEMVNARYGSVQKMVIEQSDDDFNFSGKLETKAVIDYDKNHVAQLFALSTKWENIQKMDFAWTIYAFLKMMGCKFIDFDHPDDAFKKGALGYDKAKIVVHKQHCEALSNANTFESETDFQEFMKTAKAKEKAESRYTIERHIIEREYCTDLTDTNAISKLVYMQDKKALNKIRNLESAVIQPELISFFAKHNFEGWNDDGLHKKHSIEKIHALPLQAHIRRLALQAIGLLDKFGEIPLTSEGKAKTKELGIPTIFTQVLWDYSHIKNSDFYYFCAQNHKVINAAKLGFKVRKDFLKKPGDTLSVILNSMGILTKSTRFRLKSNAKEGFGNRGKDSCSGTKLGSYIGDDFSAGTNSVQNSQKFVWQHSIDWDKSLVSLKLDGIEIPILTVREHWELAVKRDIENKNWIYGATQRIGNYQLKRDLRIREKICEIETERANEQQVVTQIKHHLATMMNANVSVYYYAWELGMNINELMSELERALEFGVLKWQPGGYQNTGFLSF